MTPRPVTPGKRLPEGQSVQKLSDTSAPSATAWVTVWQSLVVR